MCCQRTLARGEAGGQKHVHNVYKAALKRNALEPDFRYQRLASK